MDSKEIKAALKAARESIRTKEYKDALKQCKEVLSHDRNNYNALVFIAVAAEGLDQPDQALKAYQRATETAPTQVLAWQGLSGFYEKHPPTVKADLVDVYQKLIGFYKEDKQKLLETERKLADLKADMGAQNEALTLYESLLGRIEDEKQLKEVKAQYVKLLLNLKSLTPDQENKLFGLLRETLDSPATDNMEQAVSRYIGLLVKKQTDRVQLQEELKQLEEKFPHIPTILEVQLLVEMDVMIGNEEFQLSETAQVCIEKLVSVEDANAGVVSLGQGLAALYARDFVLARERLQQGVGAETNNVAGHFYLARACFCLHDNQSCLRACNTALKVLQRKDCQLVVASSGVACAVDVLKVQALTRQRKPHCLEEAEQLVLKIGELDAVKRGVLLAQIFLGQGHLDKAEEELSTLPDTSDMKHSLKGHVALAQGKVEEALQQAQMAIEINGQCSDHHLLLGKVFRAAQAAKKLDKAQEQCFRALLKAAKLDPYDPEIFLYLGHFYAKVQKDNAKARRCYQKAFDLDPACDLAGAALCDTLSALGEEDAAKHLLTRVTAEASAGSAKWAWMRLGLHQMKYEDTTSAIMSFQATLRADPKDQHIWECLADAYLQRGSYTAALKAFTKAVELNPESTYCMYRIASIKQLLNQFVEAVEEYKLILNKSPDYVPALKGLGETYLLLAKQRLTQYLNGLARDNCQLAITCLTRAASQRPDLSCLWKLLGDACCMLHPLATDNFQLQVPAKLLEPKVKDRDEQRCLSRQETLQLGSRCYGRALKVLPYCGSLWHDLGLSLFYQSQSATCPESQDSLATQAEKAFRKSLSLDPNNHLSWTALGVLFCAKHFCQPDKAQHCFIKSILVESNNAVAWTNLGSLYLSHGNVKLSHEAFKKAQNLDPAYVSCWIGQGLIAETVGHEDAMDLFRHTTNLAIHPEGGQGYAHWVSTILQDPSKRNTKLFRYSIVQMAAIPAASQAMAWYTSRIHDDAIAYNTYGLLLEQENLIRSAISAFLSAMDVLDRYPSKTAELKQVQCNAARVLCKVGRFQEALDLFDSAGALDSFQDCCLLGLALYQAGNLPRSSQVYEHALSLKSSTAEKSDVYAALGMLSYKFGNVTDAKTMLFKSVELGGSPCGLEALCALGLLLGDSTLALAAFQELLKLEETADSIADIVYLTSVMHLLQGNFKEGRNSILRAVHKHPNMASLWRMLSATLLRIQPSAGLTIAASCRMAQSLKSGSAHSLSITSELRPLAPSVPRGLEGLGLLAAGCHARSSDKPNSLADAQRALHLYPDRVSTMVGMATAVHAEAMVQSRVRKAGNLLLLEISFLQFVLDQGGISTTLEMWVRQQLAIVWILAGRKDQGVKLLSQLQDLESAAPVGMKLLEALKGDREAVFEAWQKSGTPTPLYPLQVLAEMYTAEDQIPKAEEVLRTCLSAEGETSSQAQRYALTKLAHLAFSQLKVNTDSETFQKLFEEATEALERMDPLTPLVPLLKGLLNVNSNKRLAKHLLRKAVESSERGVNSMLTAKKELIGLLSSSQNDPEFLDTLLSEAQDCGDQELLDFYEKLKPR